MKKHLKSKFKVQIIQEGEYYRFYITNSDVKGRIKKRVGNLNYEDLNALRYQLQHELNLNYSDAEVSNGTIMPFIDKFINIKIKGKADIFDYFDDFMDFKRKAINNLTEHKLTRSTIKSYETVKEIFEAFLKKKNIAPYPSNIDKQVLDNFFPVLCERHPKLGSAYYFNNFLLEEIVVGSKC